MRRSFLDEIESPTKLTLLINVGIDCHPITLKSRLLSHRKVLAQDMLSCKSFSFDIVICKIGNFLARNMHIEMISTHWLSKVVQSLSKPHFFFATCHPLDILKIFLWKVPCNCFSSSPNKTQWTTQSHWSKVWKVWTIWQLLWINRGNVKMHTICVTRRQNCKIVCERIPN